MLTLAVLPTLDVLLTLAVLLTSAVLLALHHAVVVLAMSTKAHVFRYLAKDTRAAAGDHRP